MYIIALREGFDLRFRRLNGIDKILVIQLTLISIFKGKRISKGSFYDGYKIIAK